MRELLIVFFLCLGINHINSQVINSEDIPDFKYTKKSYLVYDIDGKYQTTASRDSGLTRNYETMDMDFFDLDDRKTSLVRIQQPVLVCIEGYYIDKLKSGTFVYSILDSLNPQKRYKIWEQSFRKGKLNGMSKAYTIQGKVAAEYNYKDDSLVGKSKLYGADGHTIIEEISYDLERGKYVKRTYNDTSGKLMREENYSSYMLNGISRDFYAYGQVEMEEFYIDDKLNGTRRHFYPSGARWTEVEYRNGKTWTALGAYLENGRPLFPGSLSNGTGVLHIYDRYGVVQESYMFMKGEFVK